MKTVEGSVEIKSKQKGSILVLYLVQRLDAVSSPGIEKKICDLIYEGHHSIVVNFAEVSYLSSAGMRMLLATAKRLKGLSGKMVVCCVPANVMDVLKMSGFDHVLEIATTENEAVDRF